MRQKELGDIAAAMKKALSGRSVLEIACGTGYWTAVAAKVAEDILAVDISEEMLSIAKGKEMPGDKVKFLRGDAYVLETISGEFNAGVANFWLLHVQKASLSNFLSGFHKRLGSGSVVFMADNVYIPGLGGKLINKPGCEDTFKIRELADGSRHEVVKNYYREEQLREIFEPLASNLKIMVGKCFWWLSYLVE